MHPMLIVGGALHALVAGVLAFFVLFAAQKAQGLVALLGRVLGLLLLVLAILVLAAELTAPMFGGRPFGIEAGHMMYGRLMHDCRDLAPPAGAATTDAPQPAGANKTKPGVAN